MGELRFSKIVFIALFCALAAIAPAQTSGAATSTTVVTSANPSSVGQSVMLTAAVVGQVGGTPTGAITFINGSSTMGTVALSNGQASFNKVFVSAGTKSITAVYSGDTNYAPSSSTLLEGVGGSPTVTTLASSWNSSNVGQSLTFTAAVSSTSGTPTGTVTFMNGTNTMGTVALSGGQATLDKIFVSPGLKSITAIYSGDANFTTSSAALTQTVAITSTAQPSLRTLVNFFGTYGGYPFAGLVEGNDGDFYGTTAFGGANPCGVSGCGTIYKVTPGSGPTTPLFSFSGSDGQNPQAGLVLGADGDFYGTTSQGGTGGRCDKGCGTVFKITPDGTLTTLYNFSGPDGFAPSAGLVQGNDGNFYGTTSRGGVDNGSQCFGCGTVFKITPSGTLAVLHIFSGADGSGPSGLVQGNDGNFYGTTFRGGDGSGVQCSGCGTVFRITPGGALTTLYNFSGTDGQYPQAGLVQGNDGNFYGTTSLGGSNFGGTFFKITPEGQLTTLYNFNFLGANVLGLVLGTDGNFYGTTNGAYGPGGAVFRITPTGTFTLLYSFCAQIACTDGAQPEAGLVQGTDGNLYGTTNVNGLYNQGTVFTLPIGIGAESTPTVVSSVNPSEVNQSVVLTATVTGWGGGTPTGTVTFMDGTNTIGTVALSNGQASVNEVFPSWGTRSITVVYSGDANFGAGVSRALRQTVAPPPTTTALVSSLNPSTVGQSVTLTATVTAKFGGTPTGTITFINGPNTMGTVALSNGQASFNKIFVSAGTKSITAVYSGDANYGPSSSPLLLEGVGGTPTVTTLGSSWNPSSVGQSVTFRASVASTSGTPTGMVTFMNGTNTMGTVALSGGVASFNTTFISPGLKAVSAIYSGDGNFGTSSGALTQTVATTSTAPSSVRILVNFVENYGQYPSAGLVQGNDGDFYGTTTAGGINECAPSHSCGTIYKVTPGSWPTTPLYSFDGTNGFYPNGLVLGSDGNFYGTTEAGGNMNDCVHELGNGCGTVFRISPDGTLTTLYNFDGTDSSAPSAGLVQGNDGDFYGTTRLARTGGLNTFGGTVFKITPEGTLATLYFFNGTDGNGPSGLIQGSDGNFYGTTTSGGANNCSGAGCGTVFVITPWGRLTTLYNFSGTDGSAPSAGLVQSNNGDFYGTTASGGTSNNCFGGCGTVFRITPGGTLTTLYNFSGPDGWGPFSGLVQGTDGNFYGTTFAGGTVPGGTVPDGTLFRITPSGTLTLLHSFSGFPTDGAEPRAGLVQGTDGNLYGTTYAGGLYNQGTVFTLPVGIGAQTTTTVSTSPYFSEVNQSVVLTATVAGWGGGTPTGTITFINGTNTMGTVPLSGGQAVFNKTFISSGTKSITAVYSGDGNFGGSLSRTVSQQVNKATTTTTLVSSANPSPVGQSVTLTATVTPQFGGTPTGTITFSNGTVTMGMVTLSGGQASFNVSFPASGTQSLSAVYSGDVNYTASTGTLSQTVQ